MALGNAVELLRSGASFPQQVLSGAWDSFRFFESDRIFDERFDEHFVEVVRALLDVEGSRCACLRNLDEPDLAGCFDQGPIYIDHRSIPGDYRDRLTVMDEVDGQHRIGWAISVDRFVCVSEVGAWFIYCEKAEDLAFVALRSEKLLAECAATLEQLGAMSLEDAFRTPLVPHLASEELRPEWREAMFVHYGTSTT